MKTKRALICSHYMPQPDLDSYSRRLFHFVGFLREAGAGPDRAAADLRLAEELFARAHASPRAALMSGEERQQLERQLAAVRRALAADSTARPAWCHAIERLVTTS
jgi:hypothetical protein